MSFLSNESPRWLDYSGLPEKLNQELKENAWFIFKRLLELDSLANIEPDVFNDSLERISQSLGLKIESVRDTVTSLTEQGYLECYLPETDSEPAFFKIKIPVPTPISPMDIPVEQGGLLGAREPIHLKYYEIPQYDENQTKFKQILHLYFDLCGLKLNSLILDDLKELEKQFEIDKIKEAFIKAKKNKARSLRPVFAVLYNKEIKKKQRDIGEPVE